MHEAWAEQHLDALIVQLREREVVVDPDERVAAILPNLANRDGAKGGVPLRIVSTLDEAIGWLCKHSYGQLEGIVTNSLSDIDSFSRSLTASSVYVNCLPHLGDPRNSQLGAFLGISTSKLHARGPIGLENLTTVKYIATGSSLPSA
ncbi:MAG: aldehyde dehydrogenase family protein, partial [Cyanobacteria bacterium P01_A01_bin.3]